MAQILKNIAEKYFIFDRMLEGVHIIDGDWRILYVNDSAAIQDSFPKADLVGQSVFDKIPGLEQSEVYRHLANCLKDGKPKDFQNFFKYPDGTEVWYDVRINPVEEGIMLMSRDITESKQIDYQLQHENEILEERIKQRTEGLQDILQREKHLNQLKSAFVSTASHEFRTPLATIITSVNLVDHALDYDKADRRKRHLNNIKASVIQLKTILNDFLSLDKLDSGIINYSASETDIKQFSTEILQELRLLCREGQKINYKHWGENSVAIDTNIIKNVLYNLISNAIKYSPNSEDVLFTTEMSDTTFIMTVVDKGLGIPLEDQPKLFNKFFRAGNVNDIEGTGLGLNIVKRYIDLAGGQVNFTSTPKVGSKFIVTIPQ